MIGRTVSHYRIVDTVGGGGMGMVYKAVDIRLERIVALKFLSPQLSADPRAKQRFLSEARSASLLDHPNIGTIYEIDEEPDAGLFIAMAYYDGPSLDRIVASGPVPLDRALEIVAQVAGALARAHARGIVHRDIKPANILMTSSGIAKVIDFGIAKVASAALTATGGTFGTPAYMAPEQIRGDVDHRTDIWALGVVLYQMLTGRLPFGGDNAYGQAAAILSDPMRPCDEWVPAPAVEMIDRMLAKSAADRYPTMDAVAAAARAILATMGAVDGSDWPTAARAGAVDGGQTDATPTATPYTSEGTAERRQVTVLVSGLGDVAALAERLDPEDLHEVLIAYQAVCGDVVRRLDGHLAQATDDELVVYFGYPSAHEDDGKRAVRCGLEIVQAVKTIPHRLVSTVPALNGVALNATVGVHTGTIISGDRRSARTAGPTGNVANVASRTREIAVADQVVVTADTHRIIRRAFYCEELGIAPARGSTKAIGVYRVVAEVGSRHPADDDVSASPLIGRGRELELLLERWRSARDGVGQVVLVTGEAGIGKSRLVASLRSAIGDEPHLRLDCQCSAYHRNTPFHPFIELLRRMVGFDRADLAEGERLPLLASALAHHGITDASEQALFASLLSVTAPSPRDALQAGARQLKLRTLNALSRFLLNAAGFDALLLVVEDLHWIDPTSLELLALLVDRAPAGRTLMLQTCRPEFEVPWSGLPQVTSVSLARLARDQVATLVRLVTSGKSVPAEVVAQIAATTDGIPLFVEELTKALIESGALRETPDSYVLTAPLSSIDVPTTIQDSLIARLDRLPTAKPLAQLASVLGREFRYPWLAAISPVGEAVLQQDLARLVGAGLLQQRGVAPLAVFAFKHALVKDAAYQSLVRADRQQYHRRVADTFVTKFAGDPEVGPELIAHHYTEAGNPDAASRFWQLAGQRALERSHDVEAVAQLTRGLELVRKLPVDRARQVRELAIQLARAAALRATQGFAAPATGAAYTEARELALAVADSNRLITALNGLYAYHMVRAEHAQARPVAEDLVRLADQLRDETHQMIGQRALGAVLFHIGSPEIARGHLEKSLQAYDPEKHAHLATLLGTDHGETAMSFLSLALWVLGQPDQALAMQLGALAHAERLRHLHTIAQALTYVCFVRLLRRESAEVRESARRLVTLSDEHSFPLMAATGRFWEAWAIAEGGDSSLRVHQMEQAAAAWWGTGAQTYRSFAETLIADARLRAGDVDGAARLLQIASDRTTDSDERWAEPELLRVRGELALARDDTSGARALFESAVACAGMQRARMWSIRAATSLARCLTSEGRPAEARDLLAPLLSTVDEGRATLDLVEAQHVLQTAERGCALT